MIGKMFRPTLAIVALAAATFLTSCGVSSADSKEQTRTGVTPSGYPGAVAAKDAQSPALASSTETKHSNPIPKVPESEEGHGGHGAAAHEGGKAEHPAEKK